MGTATYVNSIKGTKMQKAKYNNACNGKMKTYNNIIRPFPESFIKVMKCEKIYILLRICEIRQFLEFLYINMHTLFKLNLNKFVWNSVCMVINTTVLNI